MERKMICGWPWFKVGRLSTATIEGYTLALHEHMRSYGMNVLWEVLDCEGNRVDRGISGLSDVQSVEHTMHPDTLDKIRRHAAEAALTSMTRRNCGGPAQKYKWPSDIHIPMGTQAERLANDIKHAIETAHKYSLSSHGAELVVLFSPESNPIAYDGGVEVTFSGKRCGPSGLKYSYRELIGAVEMNPALTRIPPYARVVRAICECIRLVADPSVRRQIETSKEGTAANVRSMLANSGGGGNGGRGNLSAGAVDDAAAGADQPERGSGDVESRAGSDEGDGSGKKGGARVDRGEAERVAGKEMFGTDDRGPL